jgi:hypothetical protein
MARFCSRFSKGSNDRGLATIGPLVLDCARWGLDV